MRQLLPFCVCLLSLVSPSFAVSLRRAGSAAPMAFHYPSPAAAAAAATGAAAAAAASPTATAAATAGAAGEFPIRRAAMFPGQGAQCLGMGIESARAHPASMALFRKASEILGEDIFKLCEEGPLEELNKTNKAQPALLTASMAAYTRWKDTSDEDAVSLTAKRGALMQAAAEETPGCMFAVLGLSQEETERLCERVALTNPSNYCGVANYLCRGNYAVSVSAAAAAQLQAAAAAAKAKRCVQLQVAGAFHSPLMKSASEGLDQALAATPFSKPRVPVILNVDAQIHTDPNTIKQKLLQQGSMDRLVSLGLTEAFEFGPGGVLTGILKKINPTVKMTRVN